MDKEKTLRKLKQEIEEVREKFGVEFAEVVRCKDCVYRHLSGKPPFMYYICTVAEGLNVCKDDSFCSYGERRDDDAAD